INTLLQGINNDLSFTNANDRFGRDVGFGKTIQFEFGVRHAFNPDLVIDVSAYNNSKVSHLSYRIFNFSDPTNCSTVGGVRTCRQLTINVLTSGDFGDDRGFTRAVAGARACRQLTINVLTSGDFGYDRGIDMKLDRRIGTWLQAT